MTFMLSLSIFMPFASNIYIWFNEFLEDTGGLRLNICAVPAKLFTCSKKEITIVVPHNSRKTGLLRGEESAFDVDFEPSRRGRTQKQGECNGWHWLVAHCSVDNPFFKLVMKSQ